ncbi:MAG: metallo-mystery pair system four-Cys motif protein [Myxococcales bacterium]|nr:metallo-mystery pair system four-Cys motif protein [Myxococcales bacterium]
MLSPFSLQFAASVDGQVVGCADSITGLGLAGDITVGVSDLRFYISNLRFFDAGGSELAVELDTNEFQYSSEVGDVALIDLTSNTEGTCADSAIAFAEGTSRTNAVITGMTATDQVARVAFDVGVPQAVMKETIANNTAEGAPSPLAEMYWSWASGYRHFVFNFTIGNDGGESGEGYIHIGSRDCAADGFNALEDRETCGLVNTPTVMLDAFDLTSGTVTLDVKAALAGLDFMVPILDPDTMEQIGEGPGVACHATPTEPDCASVFTAFGLDPATGAASEANSSAFTEM